jgi:hypothetical protein
MSDGDEIWHSLPPMHHARCFFACAAVVRCIIVAGGDGTSTAEVYDEALNRWIQLPYEVRTQAGQHPSGGDGWCKSIDYWL